MEPIPMIALMAVGALAYWMDTRAIKIKARQRAKNKEHHTYAPGHFEELLGQLQDKWSLIASPQNTLDADDLIDMLAGLAPQDRLRSVFAMSNDTLKIVMQLIDGNGVYVLRRHMSHPLKSTILGQPYTFLESMPGVLASTKDSVLLVDSSLAKEVVSADDIVSDAEIAVAAELIWPTPPGMKD